MLDTPVRGQWEEEEEEEDEDVVILMEVSPPLLRETDRQIWGDQPLKAIHNKLGALFEKAAKM